jgi:hypothetical protein
MEEKPSNGAASLSAIAACLNSSGSIVYISARRTERPPDLGSALGR